MATKKNLPTKYRTRSTTKADEKAITAIQEAKGCTWLEAKHEYFSAQDKVEIAAPKVKAIKEPKQETAKRIPLTVGECKLGLTIVLPMDDLKELGIKENWGRKEAHQLVREKLGLPAKGGA